MTGFMLLRPLRINTKLKSMFGCSETCPAMVSAEAIKAMKAMAADPKKRAVLVRDSTCIGGLVLVLSNTDNNIVKLALETIMLLAESPENRTFLREFIGMMDQLESLITSCSISKEVETTARSVYNLLSKPQEHAGLRDVYNTSGQDSMTSRRSSNTYECLKGLHRNAKTIILQLRGLMNKCDRDVCMKLLLQVKGVISITFDMNKRRCIVRAKQDVRPESLVHAIAKTQSIHAQQVVRAENGTELFLSFGTHQETMDKENETDLPEYLPDDDDMPIIDDKAVARDKDDCKGSSWLSSAASFLTNSFYW